MKSISQTFFFFFLLNSFLFAQTNNYNIVHYTTDEGLPQNSITTIQFDKWGYCWLGTEMGLVRFDGKVFKVFNSESIRGLNSDRIRLGTVDESDNVYLQNDKRQQILIDMDGSGTTPYPRLIQKPSMWLPTIDGYPVKSASIINWTDSIYKASGYINSNFAGFNLQSDGIYCIKGSKLFYTDKDTFINVDIINDPGGLKYLMVDGLLLIITKNNNIKAWEHGSIQEGIKLIHGPLQQNKAYQNGNYSCNNTFYQSYIYAGDTLYNIYSSNGQVYSRIALENIKIPVLSRVYYHAAQEKYYIGSLISGLYIVSKNDFIYPRQAKDAVNEGFGSQVITKEEGIICQRYLYRQDNSYRKLPLNKYVGATFFLSRQQQLYYGDEPELFRFDLAGNENHKLMDLDSRPSSIYQDKTDSGVIILSTSFSMGKMVGDKLQSVRRIPGDHAIMCTAQSGKDSFLIATQRGLKFYDFANNKVYLSILDSLYLRNVYREPNGMVWVSTYGKGYYLFENGKVYPLPVSPFTALKTIHAFIDDGCGNFWLPTNNGLYKVRKNDLVAYAKGRSAEVYFYSYSVNENLRTNEFNGGCTPAYAWMKDSMLSLPSIEGIVQFYPHRMLQTLPDNKIYADELRLNDSLIKFPARGGLVLDPDFRKLILTVSCPYYGAKDNIHLMYMIEGLDINWQPVQEDGKITLNQVSAGEYKISVRKLTGKEINDYDSLILSVRVKPWFYNTWWFYSLLFVAMAFATLVFIKARTKMLKERNRKLQETIKAQTEDLSRMVGQLKESEQSLHESNQMKDKVTTMVLHDLRSQIRFLYTISNQLVKRYESMSPAEVAQKLSILRSSSRSLNDFTEHFFVWAASQHKDFKIITGNFGLRDLLDELVELYTDIATINNNELMIVSTDISLYTDRNILAVIIRNLVDNANKNTRSGTITIAAKLYHEKVVISISDTGHGLSEAAVNEFYNENKSSGSNGNGSTIVTNLLKKIEGHLTITTVKQEGTTFNIELNHH